MTCNSPERGEKLSPAEKRVIRAAVLGLSYKAIARQEKKTARTVENQAFSATTKLGVGNRHTLAARLIGVDRLAELVDEALKDL